MAMARTKPGRFQTPALVFVVGAAAITGACAPPTTSGSGRDALPTGGEGGRAAGGSSGEGGGSGSGGTGASGGVQPSGGWVGTSAGGAGGRTGDGGAGGTATSAMGGRTSAGDSASAGGMGGGPFPAGGTSGAASSAGGTGAGGQNGGGGAKADGGPDASRDATADHLQIPDLPVRSDSPAAFWQGAFSANCTPPAIGGRAQTDGHHRPGEDCMRSGCHLNPRRPEHHAGTDCRGSGCHANGSPDGSGAPAFLFGGTVYRASTLGAASGVQIGVQATQGFYAACSASNGNFWVIAPSGTTSLTWTSAGVRLRNENGEAPMMTTAAAGCNASACHTGLLKMTAP